MMTRYLSHVLVAVVAIAATAVVMRSQAGSVSQRFPQFDNDTVHVWKSVIYPNAPLALHRHDHPRVIVALKGGQMKFVDSTGKGGATPWETGKAYWLTAMPPGAQHADVNAGKEPVEVMVVELENEH
jgi:redox-sensitive bicupin YhaK (pirin superfamily)